MCPVDTLARGGEGTKGSSSARVVENPMMTENPWNDPRELGDMELSPSIRRISVHDVGRAV